MINKIFLPGTDQQIKRLISRVDITGMNILIMGGGSEGIALKLKESGAESVMIIVDDNESLLTSRLILADEHEIKVRMMEYDNTDFLKPKFDIIYAQGAISNKKRNKIVKEIKRILKTGGYLCVGESVNIVPDVPVFVKDVWNASDIVPLELGNVERYYIEHGFMTFDKSDLSFTLKEFYETGKKLLEERLPALTENEKSYYKKVLKQISHESNVFLKLGGDRYMGFIMLILKKEDA